jgi:class 3 adenylate cyclase
VAAGEVVVERRVRCESGAAELWGALADTERLNRAVGMDRLSLTPLSGAGAARYVATTRLGGFRVEFEERPFEWVFPRRFKVLRRMRSGPVSSVETSFSLDPAGDAGTFVTLRLTLVPVISLLAPLVRFQAGQSAGRFQREIARMDRALSRSATPSELRAEARRREEGAAHAGALARAQEALRRTAGAALADRLTAHVSEGDDIDVGRIRPFALADAWGEDRRQVLSACLHGVRAGLLELRWEVVCPSCRTASATLPSLADLSDHGSCQLCDLRFGLDLDEAVEATFAPAAAVRRVDVGPYCIGGPARTPHVVAQSILPVGGVARLELPAEEARDYRLFVRGGAAARVRATEGAPPEARVDAGALPDEGAIEGADGAPQRAAPLIEVAPGGAILVENAGGDERHAKLERSTWTAQAATARIVTSMPEFRRDFSRDVLRPGASLKISRMTLLFSDLTDSTLLYATVGDAAAFKLVQDHFDTVLPLVERGRGALVKTIGDAVMAAFADEMDALAASLDILDAFARFRARGGDATRTHIKLGLYTGPCYVITANSQLDYFGQTVNVAARLQGQARSGELVIEEALAERAVSAGLLPRAHLVERYEASLKGVHGSIQVVRIRLPGEAVN